MNRNVQETTKCFALIEKRLEQLGDLFDSLDFLQQKKKSVLCCINNTNLLPPPPPFLLLLLVIVVFIID